MVILLLVHGAALTWALRRNDMRPVHLLNVAIAAVILAYNARAITGGFGYDDWLVALIAIAVINLIGSALALVGVRIPRAITWTGFGIIVVLNVLLIAFTFLFKFNRLI